MKDKTQPIRSTIWAVFEKREDKVVCQLCEATFKRSKYGTTSNLRRHIKSNHRDYAESLNIVNDLEESSSKRSIPLLQLNRNRENQSEDRVKNEMNETIDDFLSDNLHLSTIESLLFATSSKDDQNPPTVPSGSIESILDDHSEDLREAEMDNLREELRKTIEELQLSREDNKRLGEELELVNRLYLKKSIELDLAMEEIDRLKGEPMTE